MPAYLKASIKRSYAEGFLNELESNINQYFLFVAKSTPWTVETSPDVYLDAVASEYEVCRNIIGYKKLNPSNILFALPRYEWTSGTVYDVYDDSVDLFDENDPVIFYVVTDQNNIYKCLSRPVNGKSTVKPVGINPDSFQLSDGYTWKYLATIKDSNLPYGLTDYIPIEYAVSQTDTETTNQYSSQIQAVDGAITRLDLITNGGNSAAVYQYSEIGKAININDYKVVGNDKIVYVSSNDARAYLTQYNTPTNYIGYALRISTSTVNPSHNNNYAVIVGAGNTGADLSARYFVLNDSAMSFTASPSVGTGYTIFDITPNIRILGDGVGAYGFASLNSQKKITDVKLSNSGIEYSNAVVIVTTPKDLSTKVHPTIKAVLSPKGGHGSNILKELNAKDIIIIVNLTEDDADSFIYGGDYRQFGLIKNPKVNDGTSNIAGKNDPFYRDVTLTYSGSVLTEPAAAKALFNGSLKNYLLGTETSVGSSITELKSIGGTNNQLQVNNEIRFVIKVKNVGGDYITYLDRENDYTFVLPSETIANSFILGEKITQTVPAGASGRGFSIIAEGVVLSKLGSTIKVRTTRNSFVSSVATIYGTKSKITTTPSSITPVYGEYVWVFNTATDSFYSENNNKNLFRVVSVSSPYFDLNETPSYSGLTVLQLSTSVSGATGGIDATSAALTQNSFSVGDFVQQGVSTSAFGNYASGTVYNWDFVNSSYGNLYLTDVIGNFNSVSINGISGSTLSSFIVAGVSLPDIQPASGEIIYINNVRKISRVQGQKEEFRLRLGF